MFFVFSDSSIFSYLLGRDSSQKRLVAQDFCIPHDN
nr:MAG TPA: hypothetical protein [Caudoviricetes sp.]